MAQIKPRAYSELTESEQKAFVKDLKKHSFMKKSWTTIATMTVAEYAKYVEPIYGKLEIVEVEVYAQPYEYTKENGTKKKSFFLKVRVTFSDGTEDTHDLSKNKGGYDEGDLLDPSTLEFCWEEFQKETHPFVRGSVLDD